MELKDKLLKGCGLTRRRKCIDINRIDGYTVIPRKTIAVYALVNAGEIVYIGCSQNLRSRMGGHSKKEFQRIIYIPFKNHFKAYNAETEGIVNIQPSLNKKGLEFLKAVKENEEHCQRMNSMGYIQKWSRIGENMYKGVWVHAITKQPFQYNSERTA